VVLVLAVSLLVGRGLLPSPTTDPITWPEPLEAALPSVELPGSIQGSRLERRPDLDDVPITDSIPALSAFDESLVAEAGLNLENQSLQQAAANETHAETKNGSSNAALAEVEAMSRLSMSQQSLEYPWRVSDESTALVLAACIFVGVAAILSDMYKSVEHMKPRVAVSTGSPSVPCIKPKTTQVVLILLAVVVATSMLALVPLVVGISEYGLGQSEVPLAPLNTSPVMEFQSAEAEADEEFVKVIRPRRDSGGNGGQAVAFTLKKVRRSLHEGMHDASADRHSADYQQAKVAAAYPGALQVEQHGDSTEIFLAAAAMLGVAAILSDMYKTEVENVRGRSAQVKNKQENSSFVSGLPALPRLSKCLVLAMCAVLCMGISVAAVMAMFFFSRANLSADVPKTEASVGQPSAVEVLRATHGLVPQSPRYDESTTVALAAGGMLGLAAMLSDSFKIRQGMKGQCLKQE